MRRRVVGAIALLLLLSGCGGGSESDSAGTPTKRSPTTSSAPESDDGQLTLESGALCTTAVLATARRASFSKQEAPVRKSSDLPWSIR